MCCKQWQFSVCHIQKMCMFKLNDVQTHLEWRIMHGALAHCSHLMIYVKYQRYSKWCALHAAKWNVDVGVFDGLWPPKTSKNGRSGNRVPLIIILSVSQAGGAVHAFWGMDRINFQCSVVYCWTQIQCLKRQFKVLFNLLCGPAKLSTWKKKKNMENKRQWSLVLGKDKRKDERNVSVHYICRAPILNYWNFQ